MLANGHLHRDCTPFDIQRVAKAGSGREGERVVRYSEEDVRM